LVLVELLAQLLLPVKVEQGLIQFLALLHLLVGVEAVALVPILEIMVVPVVVAQGEKQHQQIMLVAQERQIKAMLVELPNIKVVEITIPLLVVAVLVRLAQIVVLDLMVLAVLVLLQLLQVHL